MITCINYSGLMLDSMDSFEFRYYKPQQCLKKYENYSMVFFRSGKCRIMGCKKALDITTLPYNIKNIQLQSISIVEKIGQMINLQKLSQKISCSYEPELFPALRLTQYNPICVNIFSSGKIVIMGLKTFDYGLFVADIVKGLLLLI